MDRLDPYATSPGSLQAIVPAVVETSPEDDATDVSVTTPIVITFSESVVIRAFDQNSSFVSLVLMSAPACSPRGSIV